MKLPFGEIQDNRLVVSFNSADYSVASVMTAVKERCDMFGEMKVAFLGVCTEIPPGPSPVFRPVNINAYFDYTGNSDPRPVLERVYVVLWEGMAVTFPNDAAWAAAKGEFARYISAQADLLRARIESSRTPTD